MSSRARLAWIALVAAWLWIGVWPEVDAHRTSFPGYWVVARELIAGTPVAQLYDDPWLSARMLEQGFPPDKMFGPPSLVLTALPVAWLPYPLARGAWLLVVLAPALIGCLCWLSQRLTRRSALLLVAAWLFSRPVRAGMEVGQIYPLMLAAHCAALAAWRRSDARLGGLALAPMLLIRGWYGVCQCLGWLVARRPGGALWAVGGVVAAGLVTLPWVGWDAWRHFLLVQIPTAAESQTAWLTEYQTWRSLSLRLTTLAPPNAPDPPIPGDSQLIWLFGAFALALFTIWRARLWPPGHTDRGFALWTALGVLLAPVAEDHHMVLLALPTFTLWHDTPRARPALVLSMLLVLPPWAFTAPELWGGWRSLAAYPRVYGAFILWAVAAFAPGGPIDTAPQRQYPQTSSL